MSNAVKQAKYVTKALFLLCLTSSFKIWLTASLAPSIFFRGRCHLLRGSKWMARKPPTSGVDLEAIEAFEAQLDAGASYSVEEDYHDMESFEIGNNEDSAIFTISPELDNLRIDAAVAKLLPDISRSVCGNLIDTGRVCLLSENGSWEIINRKSFKVETGQDLRVSFPSEDPPDKVVAQDLPLDILFEDEHMIVLNKAANMVVHPAAGNWNGTVVNALAYYLQSSPMGGGDFVGSEVGHGGGISITDVPLEGIEEGTSSFRPGIVHRLDKGTTGVLVVAKTKSALAALSEAFSTRQVKKTYLTIAVGNPGKSVTIDKPIDRHPVHRQRMRVVPDPHRRESSGAAPKDRVVKSTPLKGRRAVSHVETLAFDGKLSFVKVRIETGRTHQIRVHLQDRHTPIYGDELYGLPDWNKRLERTHRIQRPLLHAYKLEIKHPVSGEHLSFTAPLPEDMLRVTRAIVQQGEESFPEIFQAG